MSENFKELIQRLYVCMLVSPTTYENIKSFEKIVMFLNHNSKDYQKFINSSK